MRILIVGAGALGGFYGALLARAGNDVTILARGAALDALRQSGLTLESAQYGSFAQPVAVVSDAAAAGEIDLIFFAVKAYDLDAAAAQIAPLVHDGVTLLAVQNGIEHPQQLAAHVGQARCSRPWSMFPPPSPHRAPSPRWVVPGCCKSGIPAHLTRNGWSALPPCFAMPGCRSKPIRISGRSSGANSPPFAR